MDKEVKALLIGSPYYGLDTAIAKAYLASLLDHIRFVREAGEKVGGIPAAQLLSHDDSKFSMEEFRGYAMHFHGGGAPDWFAFAWLHHIRHNPHHWQHWMFPDNFTPKGSTLVENGCVEMPECYAREMVADWMGSSMAYTGSWDMRDWLIDNMPRIRVHSATARVLYGVLSSLGYRDIVEVVKFQTAKGE